MKDWETLFNQKLKEVMKSSSKYHVYATLSPTANGSCARELIAEEYYQQADRIAELEKVLQDGIQSFGVMQEQMLKEKLFGAEPVAWWCGKKDDESEDFIYPETRQNFIDHPLAKNHLLFPIPLYTTPQDQADRIAELEKDLHMVQRHYDQLTPQTKPLSDEEIDRVINGTAWVGTEEEIRLKISRAIEKRILGK